MHIRCVGEDERKMQKIIVCTLLALLGALGQHFQQNFVTRDLRRCNMCSVVIASLLVVKLCKMLYKRRLSLQHDILQSTFRKMTASTRLCLFLLVSTITAFPHREVCAHLSIFINLQSSEATRWARHRFGRFIHMYSHFTMFKQGASKASNFFFSVLNIDLYAILIWLVEALSMVRIVLLARTCNQRSARNLFNLFTC